MITLDVPISPNILHTWWGIEDQILCGEYPYTAQASSHKIEALIECGFDVFVDLTHPDDGLEQYQGDLVLSTCDNLTIIKCPIPDDGVVDIKTYLNLITKIAVSMDQGEKIYIHCWGGVGRTATVMGGLLAVCKRWPAELIFQYMDQQREGTAKADRPAPYTAQQRDIVREIVSLVEQATRGDY
jgi:hypothetical protein